MTELQVHNYLGEMLEWAGWALATWSLAGSAFALFTLANLLPRARESSLVSDRVCGLSVLAARRDSVFVVALLRKKTADQSPPFLHDPKPI